MTRLRIRFAAGSRALISRPALTACGAHPTLRIKIYYAIASKFTMALPSRTSASC